MTARNISFANLATDPDEYLKVASDKIVPRIN